MVEKNSITTILLAMADRLHAVTPYDDMMQPNRGPKPCTAHQLAVECRRAANLQGQEPPPKDWVASLLYRSRKLGDATLTASLAEAQTQLEAHYGHFPAQRVDPNGSSRLPSLAELRARLKSNDNTARPQAVGTDD